MTYTNYMKKRIMLIFIFSIVVLFCFAIIFNFVLFPKKYKNYVVAFADEYDLEIGLVYAIIKCESDFDKNAISKSGALGLMQILPSTAKWIAGELGEEYSKDEMFNPKTNIKFGCFYLRYLQDKFESTDAVICAYNAGEGKVKEWLENGEIILDKIDYEETKNYLKRVKKYYRVYKNKLVNF